METLTQARALLFDLDGTLVDTMPDIARAANAALSDVGREPVPIERMRAFVGNGARWLVQRCLGDDAGEEAVAAVLAGFRAHYRADPIGRSELYPGVLALLDRVRDRRLAVVSNKPVELCRAVTEGLGVAARFAVIAGDGSHPARKPDPAPFLGTLAELGVPAAEAAVIGDGLPDLRGGRAAGIATCAALWGYGERAALLGERPDFAAGTVAELAALLVPGERAGSGERA